MLDAAKEVYGDLLWRHLAAARKNDLDLRNRIFNAVIAIEEIYPEETAAYKAQFSTKG